ncbi:glycosyltransferase family 4 protein [Cupriavidus sp. UGS-1]|uniref:glycosyltransferase family 4 protein n=1 Tax=Cupriavidus sp. UGS-1 TaxID=2899826 RepID=UPI001E619E3B|nr:glycosyltransferase family 4 protein [Cupriavidus sp. UGS-1]MCD9120511.1 glycosyltransferase family 4 protein [Cupriavidus sp. UGS-1]
MTAGSRVLILSQYFWPENFRFNELAVELARRGHAVTVLTGVPNYPQGAVFPSYRQAPADFSALDGVDIVRVPMMARGTGYRRLALNYLSFALSASVLGPWKLRGRRFDHVFVCQPSPGTVGLPGVVLSRLKRASLMLWVQDLWPESISAVGAVRSPRLLAPIAGFMAWVYRRCDHVFSQSRAYIPLLNARVGGRSRVSYLPNWGDGRADDGTAARPMAAEGGKDGFDIYYLGNLGHAQGFAAVLDAVQAAGDDGTRWHFVGAGSAASWMADEVARRGLGARVRFHGLVSPDQLPRFYQQADALLVTLKPDPLFAMTVPSKVQSYLATGVPIVAMLDGEGARVVEDAGAGVTCAAGDSAALLAAVRRLRALPARTRHAMGESARRYYDSQFSFARVVDKLEGWLRSEPMQEAQGENAGEEAEEKEDCGVVAQ